MATETTPEIEANRLFAPLEREATLPQRMARQMESMIQEGQILPGERLPPERELARQFGVSRTVVREAVAALVARGLLGNAAGRGTMVCHPNIVPAPPLPTPNLPFQELLSDTLKVYEVCRALEVEFAGLAAERRSEEDLVGLAARLRDMAAQRVNREGFVEKGVAFHEALVRAARNDLLTALLDLMLDSLRDIWRSALEVRGAPEALLAHHRGIYEQVRVGDIVAARQAAWEHLIDAEALMRQSRGNR